MHEQTRPTHQPSPAHFEHRIVQVSQEEQKQRQLQAANVARFSVANAGEIVCSE